MPKKGFSIPKLHPRAKEAIGLLKKHSSGTKAIFRQRAQILHDFYSNEDTSPSYVTVHVFISIHARVSPFQLHALKPDLTLQVSEQG